MWIDRYIMVGVERSLTLQTYLYIRHDMMTYLIIYSRTQITLNSVPLPTSKQKKTEFYKNFVIEKDLYIFVIGR